MSAAFRPVPAAALALALSLTAACGGTSQPAHPAWAAAGSLSAPSSPARPASVTAAGARRLAAAVNLRAADLPGFTASPHVHSAQDTREAAELAACAGGIPPDRAVADINSDDFRRGAALQLQQVDSDVTVMPSHALVRRDLAALRSARARTCLQRYITQVLDAQTSGALRLVGLRIDTLPVPAGQGAAGFAYRFTVTAAASGHLVAFFIDELGFATGPAEVSLTTLGISAPFPAALESHLFGVLVARASRAT